MADFQQRNSPINWLTCTLFCNNKLLSLFPSYYKHLQGHCRHVKADKVSNVGTISKLFPKEPQLGQSFI